MANKNALLLIANRQIAIPEATDPDTSGLHTDSAGNLNVNVAAGGGAGGTSSVDESPFTAALSAGTPLMGVVDPSDTPADGLLAVVALDSARRLKVAGTFSASPVQSNTATTPAQKTISTTAGVALAANALRKRAILQNTGTTVLKFAFGAAPTQTAYHFALTPGGTADDGSSRPWIDDIWIGQIQVISSGAGGTYEVTELT